MSLSEYRRVRLIANSETFEDELLLKRIKARFYTEQAEQRAFDIKRGTEELCRHFGVATLQGFGIRNDSPDIAAAGASLGYLGRYSKERTDAYNRDNENIDAASLWVFTRRQGATLN